MGFFQGDIKLLPDDMKTLQPTIFPVVPRLLNRVYDKVRAASLRTRNVPTDSDLGRPPEQVQSGAKTPFKKWLLNFAVDRKYAEVKEGIIRNNSLWDKLIFNKVQVLIRSRKNCPGSDLLNVNFAPPVSPLGVPGGAGARDGDRSGANLAQRPHLPPSGSGLPGN